MTAEIMHNAADENDPWATLDAMIGVPAAADAPAAGIGPMAFDGRCSTEDNQDPETSRAWQVGNARKFIEPLGGTIVAEFFDIGYSRSVPWDRRPEAAKLLAELKNPNRGWSALVVGEGTRCWFGNQFSLIAPRFAAHGVDLWVPELGGKYDPRNPSHKMLMSVLGGMSESERQHVQARVRAAMDAQVLNEGRHQGGRAPYGYQVIDGGPHPNPSKAAEGHRLRLLALDEPAAEVVRRIFTEYLAGRGDRAIATGLNREGIPCPSANRPEQNRHRRGDGWQSNTIRAILENPRYTGYAVFGRSTRQETLLDPDDVAAGYVTRFRPADAAGVIRSRRPAHPEIVPVDTFTQVQLLRRSKGAAGLASARRTERSEHPTKRRYLLRGLVRCGVCERKMEASPRKHAMYYRCPARTLAPNSPLLDTHPPAVYLREDDIRDAANEWLAELFAPENRDNTVRALVDGLDQPRGTSPREEAKRRLAKAETELRRFQDAIAAGIDAAAVAEPMNQAQAVRAAAEAALSGAVEPETIDIAAIYAMLDAIGDKVNEALNGTSVDRLADAYAAANLRVLYVPEDNAADMSVEPVGRVNSAGVRGGRYALATPIAPTLQAA